MQQHSLVRHHKTIELFISQYVIHATSRVNANLLVYINQYSMRMILNVIRILDDNVNITDKVFFDMLE